MGVYYSVYPVIVAAKFHYNLSGQEVKAIRLNLELIGEDHYQSEMS